MKISDTNILNKKLPSQEQIIFGLLLTFVGGFFDSYSFINSHGVFANSQTGNLIFVGIEIANSNYYGALNYLPPVMFFIIGVMFNELILYKNPKIAINRYINFSLFIQILVLIFAYIFPYMANVDIRPLLISFVCAMQFDSFRTINKIPFASIFCTGNLRSASEHIFKYFVVGEKSSKAKIFIYSLLIIIFLLGVIAGGVASNKLGHHALLFAIIVMIINLIFAAIHDKKRSLTKNI